MERGSAQAASSAGIIRKPQASGRAWNAGQARKKAATTAVTSSWYSNAGENEETSFCNIGIQGVHRRHQKSGKISDSCARAATTSSLGQIGLREREVQAGSREIGFLEPLIKPQCMPQHPISFFDCFKSTQSRFYVFGVVLSGYYVSEETLQRK